MSEKQPSNSRIPGVWLYAAVFTCALISIACYLGTSVFPDDHILVQLHRVGTVVHTEEVPLGPTTSILEQICYPRGDHRIQQLLSQLDPPAKVDLGQLMYRSPGSNHRILIAGFSIERGEAWVVIQPTRMQRLASMLQLLSQR